MGRRTTRARWLKHVAVTVMALVMLRPSFAAAATEIAHWTFDACDLTDATGNGHTLTSYGTTNCTAGGRFSNGWSFDGVDGYLEVSDASAFRPQDHARSGTLTDALGLPLSVGRQSWPPSSSSYRYLAAPMDEVRVYDGLLSIGEIAALYANNSTPVAPTTWGSIKALYR